MAISTKNINNTEPAGQFFITPLITPGNHYLKINSLYLKDESDVTKFGTKLILELESKPIESAGFKGFQIDAKDSTKGYYAGQIGRVEWSKWGFKDFVTNTGLEIFRDEEILKAIKTICDTLQLQEWWAASDMRFVDIYKFVEGFSAEAPFKDIYSYWCISGREYLAKDGKHTNHQLFLGRDDRVLGKVFSLNEGKVQKFFYSTHVEPLKEKVVLDRQFVQVPIKPEAKETESNEEWLKAINAPVEQIYHKEVPKDQPVYPKITSQAEANFMNDAKSQIKTEKIIESPFTDSIMEEGAESNTGIITSEDQTPLPWEL